ncbi:Acg family FMN-binding oxidoreductase [Geodermatophilus sabuli]|uniref:Acg family FMN-binding oxidoreductase n=1 Tax=Geodermatophilus sabuli TaxID=1564158 RepID=UPI000BE2AB90|nr:nitroreductase [Geodermatophilus sabuli]
MTRALEAAADAAVLAPSVHNTQPWRIVLHADSLELRADRSRQLTTVDPLGRELVQSVGAALLNVRVALAAAGRAVEVARLPRPEDPDLLAVVRVARGAPDAVLAALAPAITRRRTNRRRFDDTRPSDDLLRALTGSAAAEDTELVPLVQAEHLQLLIRLTQRADQLQNADAAYRAELRHWTNRPSPDGDGIPPAAVPHVDGRQHDDLPLRDFDTTGSGGLPAETRSGTEQSLVLLTTREDGPHAWLRSGEALERLLLELTALGWAASPMTQTIEVLQTRTQLRSALAWDAHPQFLLRIGHAVATTRTPRRPRHTVVENSVRPAEPSTEVRRPTPSGWPVSPPPGPSGRRPVPDGRGGTSWV